MPDNGFPAVNPTGLSVGELRAADPRIDADERILMRLNLRDSANPDILVRNTLNTVTAIDFVDDPTTFDYEAVPYEKLMVVGNENLTRTLQISLPRYFSQVAYRRLNFEVHSTGSQDGEQAVYFGLAAAPATETHSGVIAWQPPDGAAGKRPVTVPFWSNRDTQIVLLGPGLLDRLFPTLQVDPPMPDKALVIQPGSVGPQVRLAAVAGPADVQKAGAISVVRPEAELSVIYHPARARYTVSGTSIPGELSIVPDSASSRVYQVPGPTDWNLRIEGLYLPDPARCPGVVAVRVQLTAQSTLLTDAMTRCAQRIVAVGRERLLHDCMYGSETRIEADGAVGIRPLRLEPVSNANDPELILRVAGDHSLGWIVLPRHPDPPLAQPRSELSLVRPSWISSQDTSRHGLAIHVDWLDTAVTVQLREPDGSLRNIGLASFLARSAINPSLRVEGNWLYMSHPIAGDQNVHDESFRFGPFQMKRYAHWQP